MREIKFRAWEKKADGYQPEMIYDQKFCHTMLRHNDGYEIMQFTGILDVDGNDIYEGDIVQRFACSRGRRYLSNYKDNVRVVEIKDSRVNVEKPRGTKMNWLVTGNIYENPELIK